MNEIHLRFTFVCWVLVLPFLLCVLGLNSTLLVCFVYGWDNPLNSCFDELFCDDSNPSSLVPNPLESRVLTNWSFLRSWENPNPLWSSLEFSRSFNLLGEISWKHVHGTDVKLSSKFCWIWTLFARDSTFEALFAGCLGATGLTGRWNRSDRSENVHSSPTGLTGRRERSDRSESASLQSFSLASVFFSRSF